MSPKGALVLIVLLAFDFVFFLAAVVSLGFVGWLILNVLVFVIWLVVRKRFFRKPIQESAEFIEYDHGRATERYGKPSLTEQGEWVESGEEKIVADYFAKNNIRYEYEPAVYGRGRRRRFLIGYPDFLLPDYGVYVEYWGMVDVDDDAERDRYVRRMRWKMAQYHRNGIRFISIYPSNLDNLDWIFRAKLKEVTGLELEKRQQ